MTFALLISEKVMATIDLGSPQRTFVSKYVGAIVETQDMAIFKTCLIIDAWPIEVVDYALE